MKRLLKYKKFFGIFGSCFLFSCIFSFVICVILSPKIEVDAKEITLDVGEQFIEPEYHAYVKNREVTDTVIKHGKVNSKKLGDYTIQYDVRYFIFENKKNVIVHVVDEESPVIELSGDSKVFVCPGKDYQEIGYHAHDNYDGDITDRVQVDLKDDEVVYEVRDSSSNYARNVRKVVAKDKESPVITLKGDSNIVLYVGSSYNEAGYSAHDNCDGDITSKVEVVSNVDSSFVGNYTVTYKVVDGAGNESVVTRNVRVVNRTVTQSNGGNGRGIIYLTFDDGPNVGTTDVILNVLKEEGVSATFFVTCNGPDYLIKRMFDEGHTVALHTASHNYSYVYSSVSNYFNDLDRVSSRVQRITGQKSMIVRFPGGSSNTISKRYSIGIMSRLVAELKGRGYHYFDWNVDSNDAGGAGSSTVVYRNVVNHLSLGRENVVLMHDVKTTTRDAIRDIIRYGKNNGYTFRKITYDTAMVTHSVNN